MQNIKKAQGALSWLVLVSEFGHVFCCVLPSVFSILSIMVGMGLVGAMPIWMMSWHEAMHGFELPIIVFAGVVVAMGWILHVISVKIDCHDTGCGHGPCGPKKKKASKVLMIASVLFLINIAVYLSVHIGMDKGFSFSPLITEAGIEDGHGH
ncbi:MAG: hypothetical protein OEY94_08625 [Alphaproteobacteria bacterium]|nr:hypothetical protein [Alphaproteobacteria bacterium]